MLKELGCDQYQGYLKAMPEAAESVIARLVELPAAADL
jgi:EAL domain-containing protein (putative c-di-GMP-specific phosphodiesterase class I)